MGTTCISQKQREQSQYTQSRMQRLSQESYRTIRQCVHLQKVQIPEHYDEAIECETPSVELPNSNSNEMQLSPRNQCDSYQLIPVSDTTRSIRFHSDRDIVIQQSSMHLCVKTESFIQNRNLSYSIKLAKYFIVSLNFGRFQNYIVNSKEVYQGAYKIERVIGIGGQGTVYKVKSKNGNLDRAMKQISKIKHGKKAKSMREMEILMKLDHPHIIRAIELYQDDRHFYMITELLQGGDLQEDIQGQCFSETKAATIIVQILLAISYLHNQDIVHRDIKPENILYSTRFVSSCVKLIDFGLAQQLKSSKFLKKKIGTFYYMAPEIFQKHYGKPVDMWAIGVLLFYMIAGKQPFYGVTEQEVQWNIQIYFIVKNLDWNLSFRLIMVISWSIVQTFHYLVINDQLECQINHRVGIQSPLDSVASVLISNFVLTNQLSQYRSDQKKGEKFTIAWMTFIRRKNTKSNGRFKVHQLIQKVIVNSQKVQMQSLSAQSKRSKCINKRSKFIVKRSKFIVKRSKFISKGQSAQQKGESTESKGLSAYSKGLSAQSKGQSEYSKVKVHSEKIKVNIEEVKVHTFW